MKPKKPQKPLARNHRILPLPTTFGERLRRLRLTCGLSLREVAAYLGVDSGSMSRWETESDVPYEHHRQFLDQFIRRFENEVPSVCAAEVRASAGTKVRSFDHPLTAGQPATIGSLLYKRRMELGLSQSEAGKQIKVGRGAMWNWETDGAIPDHRLMARLVQFLGFLPTPKSPGRRLQIFRLALGIDCMGFGRRFKI